MDLILASASPRRAELLRQVGATFSTIATDIDESIKPREAPRDYVARMAREKAEAAYLALEKDSESSFGEGTKLILAADTSVVVGDKALGKPESFAEFESMMAQLSGIAHQVVTAVRVCEYHPKEGPNGKASLEHCKSISCQTVVKFKALEPVELENYWQSGEPQDKAGGYGIQGKGALFVESLEGSYSNVVGLPLFETAALLREFGYSTW